MAYMVFDRGAFNQMMNDAATSLRRVQRVIDRFTVECPLKVLTTELVETRLANTRYL